MYIIKLKVCGIIYMQTTEYGLEKTVLEADRKIAVT